MSFPYSSAKLRQRTKRKKAALRPATHRYSRELIMTVRPQQHKPLPNQNTTCQESCGAYHFTSVKCKIHSLCLLFVLWDQKTPFCKDNLKDHFFLKDHTVPLPSSFFSNGDYLQHILLSYHHSHYHASITYKLSFAFYNK